MSDNSGEIGIGNTTTDSNNSTTTNSHNTTTTTTNSKNNSTTLEKSVCETKIVIHKLVIKIGNPENSRKKS
jgi:hypothetical protein